MTKLLRQTKYDDWLAYFALLPALLTLAGFGISIAWYNHAFQKAAAVPEIRSDADDYVEELAKLGIAKLPDYERPSPVVSSERTDARK